MLVVTKEMAELVRSDWVRLGRRRKSLGLIADLHGTSKETIELILKKELEGLPEPKQRGRKSSVDYETLDGLILDGELSCREMAKKVGVCLETVRKRASLLRKGAADDEAGYRMADGRRFYTDEQRVEAVQRYYAGEPQTKIAKSMGLSSTTVCLWCKRYKEGDLK